MPTVPITVIPAYGRDYKIAIDAKKDWKDGKDFIIADCHNRYDGKPCSIRDGLKVAIRYNKLQRMTFPS